MTDERREMMRQFSVISIAAAAMIGSAVRAHAAVTISSGTTANMTCSSGVCVPTASDAVLNVSDLESLLASGNVEVTTTGSGVQADDIDVVAGYSWSSSSSLTLDAYHSLIVNQAVAVNGAGAVLLVTNDGGSGGTLSFIAGGSLSFANTKNSLSINGKGYTLVSSISQLASAIAKKPSADYALSANYDAGLDGTYSNSPVPTTFKGTLDGLGNTIANLSIHTTEPYVGLFRWLDAKGTIDSLNLTQSAIAVRAKMRRRRGFCVGSLAGVSDGTAFNTSASGMITAEGENIIEAGGLIGCAHGPILNSSANVSINVKGTQKRRGVSDPAIAGGLTAINYSTISESFATGSISIEGRSAHEETAGGLTAGNAGSIVNSYAQGSVTLSTSGVAGGLAGVNGQPLSQSYSTGTVSGGAGSYLGGLIGDDDAQSGDLSDNYWDTTTSGITNLSQGAGNIANDPGITGETTAQLQSGLPSGFDPTIWAEDSSINGGLPYLIANPPR